MSDPVDPEDAGVSLPGGVPLEAEPSPSTPAADPLDAGKSQQKEPIPIVLTFDDGSHAAAGDGVKNHTIETATLLKARNIIGTFFIQTHVSHRFGSAAGKSVFKAVSDLGHVIAIHTGSDDYHASHTKRVGDGERRARREHGVDCPS